MRCCLHRRPFHSIFRSHNHIFHSAIPVNEQFWISLYSSSSGDRVERVQSLPLVIKEQSKTAKEIMLQKPREKARTTSAAKEVATKPKPTLQGGGSALDSVDITGASQQYVENMQNNDVHIIFSTDCNPFQVSSRE